MATPISFTPYLGWVDATDPNNIPPDARVISASDLLRYENFGAAARDAVNELAATATDTGIANLVETDGTAVNTALSATYATVLVHDGTAYPPRPAGAPAGLVTFVGPTSPDGALQYDQWFNTTLTQVTATAPTFTDLDGTASDTYTIPTTTGVDYQVGGVTKAAGTYAASGTVTVNAVAQSGYELTGTTSWSHAFGTTNSYNTEVAADSPAIFLPLDGNVTNAGSNGETFTATALTYGAALGEGTQAAIFDGATSKIAGAGSATAGLNGATSFTVEALVKFDVITSKFIYAQASTAEFGTQATGRPGFTFQNSASGTFTARPAASLIAGTIYHLAAVYDGALLKFYVNGVEQASVAASGTLPAYSTAPVRFGTDGAGTGGWLDGSLDGTALYKNVALSAARILAHAQAAGVA